MAKDVSEYPAYEGVAATYACCLAGMRRVARDLGYALALHGSMQRDLDLIAVPWTDGAVEADVLVEAIRKLVGGYIIHRDPPFAPQPELKAHGRLGWSIQLGGGPYIDLSVMPRSGQGVPGAGASAPAAPGIGRESAHGSA